MPHRRPSIVRGLVVIDREGRPAGRVVGTYPFDGGTAEFAIVRTSRFGHRALVPVENAVRTADGLHVDVLGSEIDDAPDLDSARYVEDAVSRSRGHWAAAELDRPSLRLRRPVHA